MVWASTTAAGRRSLSSLTNPLKQYWLTGFKVLRKRVRFSSWMVRHPYTESCATSDSGVAEITAVGSAATAEAEATRPNARASKAVRSRVSRQSSPLHLNPEQEYATLRA